ADLAHEVHAHRVTAERKECCVAEREDAGETPDQIDGECENGEAQVFAGECDDVGGNVERGCCRRAQVQHDQQNGGAEHERQRDGGSAVEGHDGGWASTAATALLMPPPPDPSAGTCRAGGAE